ncbi:MAG: UDP-N-acetylglucosamine 2-epimerase (hydrolyzing) [Candidatus Brocadia sp.]|nr:UDP-N-acetylglucosamine 2-epimerase (hydrolyzing) [Candidatus Brocadia sp.]
MNKRKIAVFTGNRAEYGLLNPVIEELSSRTSLEIHLIISGSHLLEDFGRTVAEIDISSIRNVRKIPLSINHTDKGVELLLLFSSITQHGAHMLSKLKPDLIILAGDRYETFAIAVTAYYLNIPIIHLFGGDLSQGGHLDDSVRHCVTKLAHLHFTTNESSYNRILNLGEEKWRVFNVGSTVIDNILSSRYATADELSKEYNIDITKPIILFTQHPVTTEIEMAYNQVKASLEALRECGYQAVITYPSNDPGSDQIIKAISEYASIPHFRIVISLGWKRYLGFMKIASVVVGNSSSGLMETPFFKIPCVNVGTRQDGRLRAENVIDVPYQKNAIINAINTALNNNDFRRKALNCSNPYGNGGASKIIADVLESIPLNKALLQKKMTF